MSTPGSLAGHGNPNGALIGYAGQIYVDVDTSNLFTNMNGNVLWNELLQIGTPSASFTGLVTPVISSGTNGGTVSWMVPSLQNLTSYLEWGYLNVLNSKDLAPGQTDRFTQAMLDVTADIRATIQSSKWGFVVSGTPNSIPPELSGIAARLIILAMFGNCPDILIDKDKIGSYVKRLDVDQKWKKELLDGTMRPSNPPDPQASDVQGYPAATVVQGNYPRVTPWSMRGL
jgi:hypothetical protein